MNPAVKSNGGQLAGSPLKPSRPLSPRSPFSPIKPSKPGSPIEQKSEFIQFHIVKIQQYSIITFYRYKTTL